MSQNGRIQEQSEFHARMRRAVESDEEYHRLLEWVEAGERQFQDLSQQFKKQRLDFTTVIDIANQISSKSLDLKRFEAYTISTFRGQFGVHRVYLLRQEDFTGRAISVSKTAAKGKKTAGAALSFDLESEFCARICDYNRPFRVNDAESAVAGFPELAALREAEIEFVLPLVKEEDTGEKSLKGMVVLGRKFTGDWSGDRENREVELLRLLGNMLAISLNNAQLYHKSITDNLTQVFSRGHFDVHLGLELARAERVRQQIAKGPEAAPDPRQQQFVSLVLMDIDFFKKFNDRYGHQVGDEVLRCVGRTLKESVRDGDQVARYGGEEFALIFPGADPDHGCDIGERLRSAIERMAVPTDQFGALKVTGSFGLATFPVHAADLRTLVQVADQALYRSKEKGRNCVTRADEIQGAEPKEQKVR